MSLKHKNLSTKCPCGSTVSIGYGFSSDSAEKVRKMMRGDHGPVEISGFVQEHACDKSFGGSMQSLAQVTVQYRMSGKNTEIRIVEF